MSGEIVDQRATRKISETLEFLGGENSSFKVSIDYAHNIDPDKAAFWQFLAALLIFLIWMTFLTYYLSRICGPITAFFLTKLLRLTKTPGSIKIGSISLSLVAGKLMFRNVVYVCEDFSIRINDGWIIFSYWRFVSDRRLTFKSTASRLHVSLNGFQVHCYNRMTRYREIARIFRLERIFGEERAAQDKKQPGSGEASKAEQHWDRIWSLLGVIRFDVSSGRFIAGNKLLPYMLATSFENLESKISLKESAYDRALLNLEARSENVRASLLKHPEYDGPCMDEPPRTMGDGFAMLQTARLEFFYVQDIPGFETEEQQSPTERKPIWESVWRFGHNTVISYGPWAETQRVRLYQFFYPIDYQTAPVTEMPKRGQKRIHVLHDVRVVLLHETAIDLWFLRENQLESVHTRCRPGSTFQSSIWWIVRENGFVVTSSASLLNVESTTSLVYRRFLQCETLSLKCDIHYPREFNAKQTWTVEFNSSKPTVWLVWDHKRFFKDLIDEWVGKAPADLTTFVPYTVNFALSVRDSFEVMLTLNEGNWVDSASGQPESVEAAIVGEKLNLDFVMPFDDFLPLTTSVPYRLRAENNLALRMRVPPQSPLFPVISALFNHSVRDNYAAPSTHGSISNDPAFLEMWRTEKIEAKFTYAYHSFAGDFVSDLPYHVLEEFVPRKVTHPGQLTPDTLNVFIDIDGSEVQVTGMVVKFLIELKNNYFGLYDQLTDVATALHEPEAAGLFGRVTGGVEYYRPMDVSFVLRIHNLRAHALTYSGAGLGEIKDKSPTIFAEEFVVEIKKGFSETMVQVGLGTCIAYFSKNALAEQDGFVDLSGLQFRGHAMFSAEDVPWDMAVTEYAWLMEIILGDINARLQPAQVAQLVQFLDSFLLVAFNDDEVFRLPDRFNICQHGMHPNRCPKKEVDRPCPSEEDLKYRHLRVSVNTVDVIVLDSNTALHLSLQPIRVALCNIHEGRYQDYLTILVPDITVRQLVFNKEQNNWLEAACVMMSEANLMIQLPRKNDDKFMEDCRRWYVRKHDTETKRLGFLHQSPVYGCACRGDSRFFADKDDIGQEFLSHPGQNLAVPDIKPEGQPGFLQSIIMSGDSMFKQVRKSAYYCRHVKIDMERRTASVDTSDFKSEHGSTPSFYSALSNNKMSISSVLGRPIFESDELLTAYSKYLDHYLFKATKIESPQLGELGVLDEWVTDKKISATREQEGISSLRLLSTTGISMNSGEMLSRTQSPKHSEELVEDSVNRLQGIEVRGRLAANCDFVLSPLGLEALENLVDAFSRCVTCLHPAYLAQCMYRKCQGTAHKQPLTASLFDPREKMVSIILQCHVPPIHGVFFSVGVSDKKSGAMSEADISHEASTDVLLLRVDKSRVCTAVTHSVKRPSLRFTFKRQGDCALQFLHFIDKGRTDFQSQQRVQLHSVVQWSEHKLAQIHPNIDLRPILDIFSPELVATVDIPGGTADDQRKVNVRFGSVETTFVMCKPLEMTARHEFPVFEVLSPPLSAWCYVVERLTSTIDKLKENAEVFEDMKMIELLAEALESTDERVLKVGKSTMSVVKKQGKHLAGCPSCTLVLALLRYCSLCCKKNAPIFIHPVVSNLSEFSDKNVRRQAITALLSHWHTVICKHVKLASNEEASKYREIQPTAVAPEGVTVKVDKEKIEKKHKWNKRGGDNVPYAEVRRRARAPTSQENGFDENTPGDDEQQPHPKLDLYQYVLRAHREIKERKEGKRIDRALTKDDINPMEISLLAFFYTFHRTRKLDWSFLDELPLGLLHLKADVSLGEMKVDVVEHKFVSSPDMKRYASHATHSLLYLRRLSLGGRVAYCMEMDERNLRPTSVKIDVDYDCDMDDVRCTVAIASVCLVKELTLVGITCAEIQQQLKRKHDMDKMNASINSQPIASRIISPAVSVNQSLASLNSAILPDRTLWMSSVLDKMYDFQKSFNRRRQPTQRGNIQAQFKGEVNLSNARLESFLTDLCVAVSLQQIALKHVDTRSAAVGPRDIHQASVFLRKATLTILETEPRGKQVSTPQSKKDNEKESSSGAHGSNNQHILSCILAESSAVVTRRLSVEGAVDTHVRVNLGAIEGDLPMAAHSLHDVVLRHGAQLEQQLNRLSAQPPSTLAESHYRPTSEAARNSPLLPPATRNLAMTNRKIMQVLFHLEVASVELNAQLLPSLRAKYRLDKIISHGTTGEAAKWSADINKHEVKFTLSGQEGKNTEHFALQLPKITVNGKYNIVGEDGAPLTDKQLHYREGGYLDVVITLGHVDYNFTTDLLNQILFAEQSFRSELSLLVSRLKTSRPIPFAPGPADAQPVQSKPLLFSLRIEGRGVPWLQLTASTPTSTAVRFTLDNLRATLTNRWVVKEVEGKERIFGAAEIQLSAKLGQLTKPAQFFEVAYELQEYASFMTQIRVENKEGTANSNYSYIIALNRPILLIKSMAFDKAILLWLNYKNTYDYWRNERSKAERERMGTAQSVSPHAGTPHTVFQSPSTTQSLTSTDVDVNLSLSIQNGMYICMPLVGTEVSDGIAALVVSLEKSDVTVCVKKELACQAGFESFKVAFVDNYDEQSLSDTFFKTTGDSNYFYFPQGTYQFCSQASAVTGDAEWVLSVRSQMQGMRIDLDQRIGRLTKMLVNTFSSLGDEDDEFGDEVHGSSVYSDSDFGEEDVNVLEDAADFKKIQQPEGRIRWLERKMHEQSMLVSDLLQKKDTKEELVEGARRKLRQLELIRFKQFRRSVIEKWKRNRAAAMYRKPLHPQLLHEQQTSHGLKVPSTGADGVPHTGQTGTTTTASPATSGGAGRQPQDTVNMHIDVQINIASGSCILRTTPKEGQQAGQAQQMTKKPSAKDLRKGFSLQPPPVNITRFSIPSVDVKGYYLSQDKGLPPPGFGTQVTPRSNRSGSTTTPGRSERSVDATQSSSGRKTLTKVPSFPSVMKSRGKKQQESPVSKRGCFYLNIALASMPTETLVTPHLADFVEQVLEPLPPSHVFGASSLSSIPESVNTDQSGTVPIVAIDTSVLPLDVLLYLTVQSSTIRFEGQQQRSSAADCLLKLPCLTLMASTRKTEGAEYLGGVDISVTLSAFSLSIYSPHQQSTSHDALSLTLDHLSFVISRSKNSSQETDNKVLFALTANVGAASFNYDMRRLSELIAFPKPWYRASIMRRVFFGDQSVKPETPMPSRPSSRVTPMPPRRHGEGEKAWSATVLVTVQWKELNIFAQMSNTMGNTTWKARNGVLRGSINLNSKLERDSSVMFKLQSSELLAHGGAISGQLAILQLRLCGTHVKKLGKPPQNTARAQLRSISTRIEWMSRAVLIASCTSPSLSFADEWTSTRDSTGQASRSSVSLSVEGRWDELQMVITRVTVDDMIKIANKLASFFQEQLRSSKMVWGLWEDGTTGTPSSQTPKLPESPSGSRIWECVLDALTTIQIRHGFLPLPSSSTGETIVGGSVQLEAGGISLACMHGEMNANSWALFHMRQPMILFTPEASFSFVDDANSAIGVSQKQKLILRLGPDPWSPDSVENLATVYRVQQSRSSVMRQNASIDSCLEYVVGAVLKQMNVPRLGAEKSPVRSSSREADASKMTSPSRKDTRGGHSVLELFQFPALEAVLTSYQLNPCAENVTPDSPRCIPEVRSSFVCDFHNPVYVQTDFNAQVSFLPELLKSYMTDRDDAGGSAPPAPPPIASRDEKKDVREYKCEQWEVDPKIRFIDRFKWNPPVIDEVLRKLQIFDHRTTIPKALQRGMLDPLDQFLAHLLKEMLNIAAKG